MGDIPLARGRWSDEPIPLHNDTKTINLPSMPLGRNVNPNVPIDRAVLIWRESSGGEKDWPLGRSGEAIYTGFKPRPSRKPIGGDSYAH